VIKFMLDTNILIYTINNRPTKVRKRFSRHEGQLCISTVSWGELVYGCEKSSRPEENLADIESMANRLEIAVFDATAAAHSGQIRAELARLGKSIGPYDMMIAGHARSLGMVLVTNNVKEFRRVSGLRVENWT
jgi:tRNA(fMet)-specific endonuclease VapC